MNDRVGASVNGGHEMVMKQQTRVKTQTVTTVEKLVTANEIVQNSLKKKYNSGQRGETHVSQRAYNVNPKRSMRVGCYITPRVEDSCETPDAISWLLRRLE